MFYQYMLNQKKIIEFPCPPKITDKIIQSINNRIK